MTTLPPLEVKPKSIEELLASWKRQAPEHRGMILVDLRSNAARLYDTYAGNSSHPDIDAFVNRVIRGGDAYADAADILALLDEVIPKSTCLEVVLGGRSRLEKELDDERTLGAKLRARINELEAALAPSRDDKA